MSSASARVNAPRDDFEITDDYGADPIHGQTSPSAVLT